ncbi:MAG: UDP-N-acetylmuramate dehydrogenase [Candidatus Dormibacteria bacterium]
MSRSREWLLSLPGIRQHHSLAAHTTYRIGGPAEFYLEPRSGLTALVSGCAERGIPLTPLGNGSNVLVADAGIEGLVIRPADTTIAVDGVHLRAAAGARMVKVAQAAERSGLTGMEWALGIPGTVGGSVHNNAGCFGSDIASTLGQAEGILGGGPPATWSVDEMGFEYRASALRCGNLVGGVVTSARFDLRAGDPTTIRSRMLEIGEARHLTQPVSGRSTGSVFKNPPGDHAGRLVEAAGLKGRKIGGAMVSLEHANFIINAGRASAGDVAALVSLVRQTVRDLFGVILEAEIEAVGRWPMADARGAWPSHQEKAP